MAWHGISYVRTRIVMIMLMVMVMVTMLMTIEPEQTCTVSGMVLNFVEY